MSTLALESVIDAAIVLLTEAYAGPPDPSSTWFIDNEPDSGILGLIAGLSAAEASASVDATGEAGTTIAAHVEHLRWSLANANAALAGGAYDGKWAESWRLRAVDQAEWDRLRREVRAEFETLRQALGKQTDLQGEYLLGVLALVPHAAYHLGTIRQMIGRVRMGPR